MEYTDRHIDVMELVKDGATIFNGGIARLLRDIENDKPELIDIVSNIKELEKITGDHYDGITDMPYFGAMLTGLGKLKLEELKEINHDTKGKKYDIEEKNN